MIEDGALATLIGHTGRLLRDLGDATVEGFLSLWPTAPVPPGRMPPPCALPVLRWLDPACAAGAPEAADLLAGLRTLAPSLAWAQTYTAAEVGPAFLDRYGWTELIGLRGPVPSGHLAAGFLLLGPDTEYPPHRHAAEEIYVPLTGRALWQRGVETWRERAPCRPIHHAPWQTHAMRTEATPLLALYLWRGGDLTQKSQF